ncbi:MAG: hypothetical protein QG656_2184, partial [Candidatus Hydrogenedentes bacterium]|nr:hypothetical protein [Candidatus Hydrogenedentota bacterium]
PLDFTNATGTTLEFEPWLNKGADATTWLEYKVPLGVWEDVYPADTTGTTMLTWDHESYALPNADGENGVKVRWGYHAGAQPFSGWNIDDVAFKAAPGDTGLLNGWALQIEPMEYLTSDPLTPFDFTADTSVTLGYQRWLNKGDNSVTSVEVYDPAVSDWVVVANLAGEITDAAWTAQTHDITAQAAGKNGVMVRWGYNAGTLPYSGWNIDDAVLLVQAGGGALGTLNSWELHVEPRLYVTTPVLDFTGKTGVTIDFEQWLNKGADASTWLEYYVPSTSTWEPAYPENVLAMTMAAWGHESYPLPLADGENGVRVRWGYHAGIQPFAGWNIDDMAFKAMPGGPGVINAWSLQVEPMQYVTTPVNDFTTNTAPVRLVYSRWLNKGSDALATVELNPGTGVWSDLTAGALNGLIADNAWSEQTYPLPGAEGQNGVQVRWGYHAGQLAYSGWNIDDIMFFVPPPEGPSGTLTSWKVYCEPMFYLTTPAPGLDCTLDDNVQLEFSRWLNTGADGLATVEYYSPTGPSDGWQLLWRNMGAVTDSAWFAAPPFNCPLAANQTGVQFRWGYHAGQMPYTGWNIDDIRVVIPSPNSAGLVSENLTPPPGKLEDINTCAYGNSAFDRLNWPNSPTQVDLDPDMNDSSTWGKLNSGFTMGGKGDPSFTMTPYTDIDFEGDLRASPPAIGCDEPSAGGGTASWFWCEVPPWVGAVPAQSILVHVRTTGLPPDAVFIAPQGLNENDYGNGIALTKIAGAGNYWYGTNASAITTLLHDGDGIGGISGPGDVVADGHAAVYVFCGGTGPGSSIPPTGDAIVDRHLKIDTIPPVMFITGATDASVFVAPANDAMTANWPIANNPRHAGYAPIAGGFLQADTPWPLDGAIMPPGGTSASLGASILLNPDSWTNNLVVPPNVNLDIAVTVSFVDPTVKDNNGNDFLSLPDVFCGLTNRQVAGFDLTNLPGPGTPEEVMYDTVGAAVPPAKWLIPTNPDADSLVGGGVTVTGAYVAAAGTPNMGYNPVSGAAEAYNGDAVDVAWTFSDSFGNPGIPYDLVNNSGHKLLIEGRFAAMDAIGNRTELLAPNMIADPINIWWINDTAVEFEFWPNSREVTLDKAEFGWRLRRSFVYQSPANAVRPIYSFSIWRSSVPGKAGYNMPYAPLPLPAAAGGGWQAWSTNTNLRPDWFQALELEMNSIGDTLQGYYLLLVVEAADEAGNVTPWDMNPLDPGLSYSAGMVTVLKDIASENYQRFFIVAPETKLDTTLTHSFWHEDVFNLDASYNASYDGKSFGTSASVTQPPANKGQMLLGRFVIDRTPGSMVKWELSMQGNPVPGGWGASGDFDIAGLPIGLPLNVYSFYYNFPSVWDQALPGRPYENGKCSVYVLFPSEWQDVVYGTFRATSYVVGALGDTFVDSTPVTFNFTVVPWRGALVEP